MRILKEPRLELKIEPNAEKIQNLRIFCSMIKDLVHKLTLNPLLTYVYVFYSVRELVPLFTSSWLQLPLKKALLPAPALAPNSSKKAQLPDSRLTGLMRALAPNPS